MCTVLRKEYISISNRKEILLLVYTLPPVRTLYGKPETLNMICFFLYPRNLNVIKYVKLSTFFIILFTVPCCYAPLDKISQLRNCINCLIFLGISFVCFGSWFSFGAFLSFKIAPTEAVVRRCSVKKLFLKILQ